MRTEVPCLLPVHHQYQVLSHPDPLPSPANSDVKRKSLM